MDNENEEVQGVKFSEFPSATPESADEVVGLHSGNNARFSLANIVLLVRQGLANIFVPNTRKVNNKALSSDITLDASDVGARSSSWTPSASDVGAVPTTAVGSADGVASLGNDGKVPAAQLPPISAEGKADESTIAPTDSSTTATEAHPLGSIFYLSGVLYRALSDIAIGGTINTASGGNATQTTIAENFSRIVKLTSAQYAQLSAAEKAADIVYIVTDDPAPSPSDSTPQDLGTAAAGTSGDYSRADHVHKIPTAADIGAYVKPSSGIPATDLASGVIPSVPSAYTSNPAMDGTASPGSSGSWAKGDHVHPSDTSKANETELAYVETGSTASQNYSAGQYICWNGSLYTADTAIASGATLSASGGSKNLTAAPGGGLNDLKSAFPQSLSAAGLTALSNCVIGTGGVFRLGNIVFLSVYVWVTSASSSATVYVTLDNSIKSIANVPITLLAENTSDETAPIYCAVSGPNIYLKGTTANKGYIISGFWLTS